MSALSNSKEVRSVAFSATITAASVIGSQIAAKATRDSVFLSTYDITDLPLMLIAASLVSIAVILLSSKLMVRLGPARLVPLTFIVSSAAYLGIWALMYSAPRVAAIALYLHISAFGVMLISGFWSMVNERFDPHTARKMISRIVGGATFGGLVGGILAERLAASTNIATILPCL